MRPEEASMAMKALNGYPYAHLILRVEYAKESKREGGGGREGGLAGGFVSGYGRALPQG